MPAIRTDKELFTAIRALGLTIRKSDGEYRVAPLSGVVGAERAEAMAYYTNDREDALGTAKSMVEWLRGQGQDSATREPAEESNPMPTESRQIPTFNGVTLTENEFRASLVLVKSCLNGMGGKRPADLEQDEYTWVEIEDLMAEGWTRHEAAGTFSALNNKSIIFEYDRNQMCMTTEAWRWLDTVWDEWA